MMVDWPSDRFANEAVAPAKSVYLRRAVPDNDDGIPDWADDEEFNAWLKQPLPADGEADPLPPKLQEEHDRLLAELEAESPSRLRLAPDLAELERRIEYAEDHEHAPPVLIHRFVAITSIRGGMGLVIKAHDPLFERDVAIKLWMRPGAGAQEALIAEAVTLAKLKHRNVVTVYEPGLWGDHLFIVMEWIEGVDGHEWMERGRSWQEVRQVFIEAGTGLAAAHDAEIQHGDFKPSNILIGDDGRVVVADFGLADSLSTSPEREETLKIAGTTSYMAPERLRGERGDGRSDQFSFCVAMWRALYRQRPFAGETTAELIESIERGEIEETPGIDVPRWLSAVLRTGLAVDPDERYRDMRELLDALRRESSPEGAADDERTDDGEVVAVDGRVLHTPRWGYFAAAVLSAVAVLGATMLTRSPAPEPVAGVVEAEAYTVILGLILSDRFTEATRMWSDNAQDLSDEQSLQIARFWLSSARQRAVTDRSKAHDAASAAHQVAEHVQDHGLAAEAKIYALIAADDFEGAEKHWRDNKAQLTDEQTLQLAEDCLALAPLDRTKAIQAALTAWNMANEVQQFGSTEAARTRGGRLVTAALAVSRGR
jgi:hypothetical protein